jgi:hypothetical protein
MNISTGAPCWAFRKREEKAMSIEIETKMTEHTAVEFWGGDRRGECLQVTASTPLKACDCIAEQLQEEGYIQLTMEEAAALCNTLGAFVQREAVRRQELLKADIERLKIDANTVFHEVAALPADLMAGPELAVLMVSKLCPKTLNKHFRCRTV